jgi:hypothetical protein
VHLPGLDNQAAFRRSGLVSVTDIGRYLDPNQPVVVIDATSGERWPVWSELDVTGDTPGHTDLVIHPAVNFQYATRYVVGLHLLKEADGTSLTPPAEFARYRDGKAPPDDRRRPHMEELFHELGVAGVSRSTLDLAWDFTVASVPAITGRLLSMRDRSFAALGDNNLADRKVDGHAPPFHIVSITDRTPAQDPYIARQVALDVEVPCFLWPSCSLTPSPLRDLADPLAAKLNLGNAPDVGIGRFLLSDPNDPYAVPIQNPLPYQARVLCNIPRSALESKTPMTLRPSLLGHGLLGTPSEVDAAWSRQMAATHGMLYCATDWLGMAEGDIPNALISLVDLAHFPSLVDRTEQGVLDFLLVGRAMIAPGGLATSSAFQVGSRSLIDTRHLYYDGNSQGGIFGGTVVALEPDVDRAVLGVPGMDYSVLLDRSADFVPTPGQFAYAVPFEVAYQNPAERLLCLSLIQMLWDRSDPDGYAARMTSNPLPNTPPHRVLLQAAFGDHQVANVAAETEARTIGASVMWPALEPGRSLDQVPYWGMPRITAFPFDGSAFTMFDTGPPRTVNGATAGVGPPPPSDVPNRTGADPHGAPRAARCGQLQKSDFLQPAGVVTAPCGGPPYFAGGYRGS